MAEKLPGRTPRRTTLTVSHDRDPRPAVLASPAVPARTSTNSLRWAYLIPLLVAMLGGVMTAATAQEQATPTAAATPAASTAPGVPVTCRVGLALTSVHNPDLDNGSFEADFWIWSVCPDNRFDPLATMEFVNANSVEMSMEGEEAVDGVYWTYAKVSGTFRHRWDLTDFPFDEQVLRIEMEDTANVTADFAYEADPADPLPFSDRDLADWRIGETSLETGTALYTTTYGDPRQPAGSSEYSRLVLSITFERDDLTSFVKLTFVVYIAFLISLISYFLNMSNPTMLVARLSVISGTLFAVSISMVRATTELSSEQGLTLVDYIHIVALVAILVDALAALTTQLLIGRNRPPEQVTRFNQIIMVVIVISFVAANVWLIGRAATG